MESPIVSRYEFISEYFCCNDMAGILKYIYMSSDIVKTINRQIGFRSPGRVIPYNINDYSETEKFGIASMIYHYSGISYSEIDDIIFSKSGVAEELLKDALIHNNKELLLLILTKLEISVDMIHNIFETFNIKGKIHIIKHHDIKNKNYYRLFLIEYLNWINTRINFSKKIFTICLNGMSPFYNLGFDFIRFFADKIQFNPHKHKILKILVRKNIRLDWRLYTNKKDFITWYTGLGYLDLYIHIDTIWNSFDYGWEKILIKKAVKRGVTENIEPPYNYIHPLNSRYIISMIKYNNANRDKYRKYFKSLPKNNACIFYISHRRDKFNILIETDRSVYNTTRTVSIKFLGKNLSKLMLYFV